MLYFDCLFTIKEIYHRIRNRFRAWDCSLPGHNDNANVSEEEIADLKA